jgi:shikimate kinase
MNPLTIEPKRYFLVGMPASGKTHTAQLLAQDWHWNCADTDILIEQATGQSIPDLFRNKGEAHFRQLEQKILRDCLHLEQTIIATGGGLPCFADNMALMLQHGCVIWLDPDLQTLHERVLQQGQQRPLFAEQSPQDIWQKIQTLYQQRKPFYEQAHFRF